MTIYEKIKQMSEGELAKFLKEIGNIDFFTDYFCENLCKGYAGCREDNAVCLYQDDELLEYKSFLHEDYERYLERRGKI